MTNEYGCVEELEPTCASMEKLNVPFAVGVPKIVVVLLVDDVASERPLGKAPDARVQVNVPVAVVEAVRICEHAPPTVPDGTEVGIMESAGWRPG